MAKVKLLVGRLIALALAALMLWSMLGCNRHYIAYGDSITEGCGDCLNNRSCVDCDGYPPKLESLLSIASDYTYYIHNEGKKGKTAAWGKDNIQTVLDKEDYAKATHVLIQFGTNDALNNVLVSTFKDNMQAIINKTQQEKKTPLLAKIPIGYGQCSSLQHCDPYPDPQTAPANKLIRDYNVAIDELVRENQIRVSSGCLLNPPDFYAYFEATGVDAQGKSPEFDDRLHPNTQGYQAMAQLWMNALWEGRYTWRNMGGGVYYSPAIGADGTVYIGVNEALYAFSADGAQRWSIEIGTPSVTGSPAIGADGTIYVGSANGDVHAISPDGAEKPNWPFRASGSDGTAYAATTSPAIAADGTVYIGTTNGDVHAISPDGAEKPNWPFHTGAAIKSSPAIGMDGTIYIGSDDGKIYALNPDGSEKWSHETGDRVRSSPAIGVEGTIYIGSDDGMVYAIDSTGRRQWSYQTGSCVRSSPAIGSGGTIYVGSDDGKVHAINSDGTARANWDFETGMWVRSSPAIARDGTIFVGSNDSYIYVINADATLRCKLQTDLEEVESSAAIGPNGMVYIGDVAGRFYTIRSSSSGLADSPWPMFRHDLQNTGRAGGP